MLTNDQMKPRRYLRYHEARRIVARIQAHLTAGGRVVVATCTQAKVYGPKHVASFKATRTGAWVARGKSWDCIDYCGVKLVE